MEKHDFKWSSDKGEQRKMNNFYHQIKLKGYPVLTEKGPQYPAGHGCGLQSCSKAPAVLNTVCEAVPVTSLSAHPAWAWQCHRQDAPLLRSTHALMLQSTTLSPLRHSEWRSVTSLSLSFSHVPYAILRQILQRTLSIWLCIWPPLFVPAHPNSRPCRQSFASGQSFLLIPQTLTPNTDVQWTIT